MIYRHKYLSQDFLTNKSIHKVTEERPIVILLSEKFTFLNDFVVNSLRINQVPFEIKYTQEQQVMSHRLPAIAFKDYFLSQESLIEFIGDLWLHRESLVDLMERKTLGRDVYRKWIDVLKEENNGLSRYSNLTHLGIQTEQDYLNHLFSQFFAMASWVKSDILERKYDGFRRNQINFEALLVYDTVKSILKLCQKTKVDHILRANFENLIDFHQDFEKRIDGVLNADQQEAPFNEIQVATDKVEELPVIEYSKFSQNWKKFTLVFTIVAGIYIKWVE